MKAIKVAAVQAAPIFLDLNRSIDKAEQLITEAARNGAKIIAFPETWLPGYPWFVWLSSPAEAMQFFAPYHHNSMDVNSEQMNRLQAIAQRNDIFINMGFSERENGTRYMSQAMISNEGDLLQVRRKLKPTFAERMVFGEGDGSDLEVVNTSIGRIGALNCWEHAQPLVRMAMHAQGEDIHVAAWPSFCLYRDMAYALGPEVNNSFSRTYAVEGSCYVLAPCATVSQEMFDIMAQTPEKAHLLNPRTSKPGGGYAMIYAPDGREMCEPLADDEEGILYADLDPVLIDMAKVAADPRGHYARPDVLRLVLNKEKRSVMSELNSAEEASIVRPFEVEE
ncbi:Nitrilase [Stappia aggregata IAM 12614]|uniref:Nitrilase n=1 Tax=Roseibium aggregatum (strain ATCC 25650 / DSM 13394 / JCM 20685 / NBRC 16684 / NCIMB 2208 / IAM 12614 / B1) TaxID=384765 RepID=A0P008_ROSAI|nr:carbon-nitrogen hydrolase family protein [Roseibium aggregatum]EAV41725.1 Nitrilase [Stappia aggregata IAM 12614] [Roseibium aggregatum IAM 12614]